MKTRKFVTSALPYVNNQPHLGNIIGSVLSSDVYVRYCRKRGQNAVHICGTDDYGTAIEMEAISQKKTPPEICVENSEMHKRVYEWFNIHFDYFGHTSLPSHTHFVQDLFLKMYHNGHFNEQEVEQFYCEACELFLADRYVVGECKFCGDRQARGDQCDVCGHTYNSLELLLPHCSICGSTPVVKSSTHLFFDLETFKPHLLKLYEDNGELWSRNARNIFKQWICMDLHPRCMTRSLRFDWGVPVPLERFRDKVFYVWFDAPMGYLTFLKELVGDEFEDWCRDSELVQFMGKDNVSFHTIMFPAMLIASGDRLPLVRRLSVTEYLQFENKKFSKSRKHGIFGSDLIDGKLGESCIWRYYLLKIRPETRDANFLFSDFQQSVTADLVNNLGNFINRVLKYISCKCSSKIMLLQLNDRDNNFLSAIDGLYRKYLQSLDDIKLRDGLQTVLEMSRVGNEYIQDGIQNNAGRRDHCFSLGFSLVAFIGALLHPFIPSTSSKVLKMCNLNETRFPNSMEIIQVHVISNDISPLFNRFTPAQVEEMKKY